MSEWIFLRDSDGELRRTDDPDYASWLCENCDMEEVNYDTCRPLFPNEDDDYQEFLKGGAEESDDIDAE